MSPRLWFLPEQPDLFGMLRRQVAVTIEGLDALVAWAGGEGEAAGRVREAEHRADDERRALRQALTDTLVAPIDPEDLYALSERLDAVMNGAKDTVREAEVMAIEPDEHMQAMARCLAEGVRQLDHAFANLLSRRRGRRRPRPPTRPSAPSGSWSGRIARPPPRFCM